METAPIRATCFEWKRPLSELRFLDGDDRYQSYVFWMETTVIRTTFFEWRGPQSELRFLVEMAAIRALFCKWRRPLSELRYFSGDGHYPSYVFFELTGTTIRATFFEWRTATIRTTFLTRRGPLKNLEAHLVKAGFPWRKLLAGQGRHWRSSHILSSGSATTAN